MVWRCCGSCSGGGVARVAVAELLADIYVNIYIIYIPILTFNILG